MHQVFSPLIVFSPQCDQLEDNIKYLKGDSRVQNVHLLAPDNPLRQLNEENQRLRNENARLNATKTVMAEARYQAEQTLVQYGSEVCTLLLPILSLHFG